MAANGSRRRRNHGCRKKQEGWNRGKIRGQRENEVDGGRKRKGGQKEARGGYGEATEEKTRLHVTSSPEPI